MPDLEVFISHASEDKAIARGIAELLKDSDCKVWLDEFELALGDHLRESIDRALSRSRFGVVILSPAYFNKTWTKRELAALLSAEEAQGKVILPVRHQVDTHAVREFSPILAGRISVATDDGLDKVVAEIKRVLERERGAGKISQPDPQPQDNPGTRAAPKSGARPQLLGVNPALSPYVGPQPFAELVAHRFYGRDEEIRALLSSLETSRTVLLYSRSGAGKSSLLNALSARELRDRGFDVLSARVGGALPPELAGASVQNIFTFATVCSLSGAHATAPQGQWRMVDYLRSIYRRGGGGRVLILDQFEEFFIRPCQSRERAEFFCELIDALAADDALRILFAARQEYLADIEDMARLLPPEMKMHRFHLKPLDTRGALEAIVKPAAPYAEFAPGVAQEIVEQLSMLPMASTIDNSVVYVPGEFVETVQLQIVCNSLWKDLPHGVTCIHKAHVERATHGTAFREFVANALKYFYEDTLNKVAKRGYSKELIQLGCRKFITDAATRTQVRRSRGSKNDFRAGRLPQWVLEELVGEHLLHAEQRGGEVWYELSHDRLAEPVSRQMNPKLNSLLFATDLLERVLDELRQRSGFLQGYFEEHRDILHECRIFHEQAGLFADESELVFRASLRAGKSAAQWSQRLQEDFPDVHANVLRDALTCPEAGVRRNAAVLLGKPHGLPPKDEFLPSLVALILDDQDDGVRRQAARSLAEVDRPELYGSLFSGLAKPEAESRALEALALIRIVVDNEVPASVFEESSTRSPFLIRRRIRGQAWRLRLRAEPVTPFWLAICAAFFAALSAAAYKWLPSTWNWAFVQPLAGAAPGVFHGIMAGPIWAGCIVFGITLHRVAFERKLAKRSTLRPIGAIVAGALAGLVSSVFIVLMIVGVYEPRSLYDMAWLSSPAYARFTPQFMRDLFITTRCGWVHLITGTGAGIGIALTVNSLRAATRWRTYIRQQAQAEKAPRLGEIIRTLLRLELRHAWPIPVCILIGAICAFLVTVLPHSSSPKANSLSLVEGLFGDCSTQALGAYFAVAGMGLAQILLRRATGPQTGAGR